MVHAADVDVVALELERVEVARGQAQRVVVGLDELERDRGRLLVALARQVAVEAGQHAHRAGGAVEVEDRLGRQGLGEGLGRTTTGGLAGPSGGDGLGGAGLPVAGVVVAPRLGRSGRALRRAGLGAAPAVADDWAEASEVEARAVVRTTAPAATDPASRRACRPVGRLRGNADMCLLVRVE